MDARDQADQGPPAQPERRWQAYLLPTILAGYAGLLWGVATTQAGVAALTAAGLFVLTAAVADLVIDSPRARRGAGRLSDAARLALWRLLLAVSLLVSSALIVWLRVETITGAGHGLTAAIALSVLLLGGRTIWREARRPGSDRASRPAGVAGARPGRGVWLRSAPFWLACLLVSVVPLAILSPLLPMPAARLALSYQAFAEQVAAGNVAAITESYETQRGQLVIKGRFVQPVLDAARPARRPAAPATTFETALPPFVDRREVGLLLEQHHIPVMARPGDDAAEQVGAALAVLVPLGILGLAGWLVVGARRRGDGLQGMSRSRARRYGAAAARAPITFADVAGIDESKGELTELVDYLRQPDRYRRLGGTMPRGVLLIGPPGAGKTLLARAVAGEAGVPFFSVSGSEFVEIYVGVGASRVRDLFAQARTAAPAIIFIDELDAIGQRRGVPGPGRNDEREQTLNQVLVEMDGFDAGEAVIVVAATNRADVLDPALLRPGRFDRRVTVHPPDRAGRTAILAVHTRGVPLAPDVALAALAAQTAGLVGADLRNLVNEAALLAARRGHDAVTAADFAEALEKIALGPERRVALAPAERERVAYHEAGHALIGLLLPEADPVRRVTVIPRGQSLGVTLAAPDHDRYNYSEAYVRARLVTILGGRAAEQVAYGDWTTGAENDLRQATTLARAMVTRWGMSAEVGMVALSGHDDGDYLTEALAPGAARPFSERTAGAIDEAIRRIIDEGYARAVALLTAERPRLEALTRALLREESLDAEQVRRVTGLAAAEPATGPTAEPQASLT